MAEYRPKNKWEERYKHGYTAFVEHSYAKVWTSTDRIPPLDETGCSAIVMIHTPYLPNPVGMSTPESIVPGFFNAQAGDYGEWYTIEGGQAKCTGCVDGWKRCDRPEEEWIEVLASAKACIECGNWWLERAKQTEEVPAEAECTKAVRPSLFARIFGRK